MSDEISIFNVMALPADERYCPRCGAYDLRLTPVTPSRSAIAARYVECGHCGADWVVEVE